MPANFISSKTTLSALRSYAFHPMVVLACSLAASSLYATYVALRFSGDTHSGQYFYVAPIIVPFVAFLFDRAQRPRLLTPVQLAIDVLVVVTAMWRVFGHLPYVSGHALFLSFALLTYKTRVAQVTAAIILLEVLFLKFFVWHDWITAPVGLLLGSIAALISQGLRTSARPANTLHGEEALR